MTRHVALAGATLLVTATTLACQPASESSPPEEETVEYEIELTSLEPQPTLSVRGPVAVDGIASAIGERTRRIWQHLQRVGAQPVGPPYTRYHAMGEEEVDLEVGFPVPEPLEGDGGIEAGRLPGGEVISTVHRGPYEGLSEAGAALDRWLEENDREARGPNWEVYRVTVGTADDPSQYETDVFKPIR